MYRKIAICLGVATVATASVYSRGVIVAEEDHAPHTPLYGALGFLALALFLGALVFYALGVILDGHGPAASSREVPSTTAPPQPPTAEPSDTAPTIRLTVPAAARCTARARVPSPRSMADHGSLDLRERGPMTVEMVPTHHVNATLPALLDVARSIGFDQGWTAREQAAGDERAQPQDRS